MAKRGARCENICESCESGEGCAEAVEAVLILNGTTEERRTLTGVRAGHGGADQNVNP